MQLTAECFHELLNNISMANEVYKAMSKDDTAEVVMTVLDILKKVAIIPKIDTNHKSESKSNIIRMAGNDSFKKGDYDLALKNYQEALLLAPKNSTAIKLIYSNRSALLLKTKAYTDCIKDIDRCFAMGCPLDIEKKLVKRKQEAYHYLTRMNNTFGPVDEFFNITEYPNSNVPSVSSQIKIEIDNKNLPKFTAIKEIKLGTVVANEVAYVTSNCNHVYTSCYYCLKFTPCLIPCDNCCHCLFCSEECLTKCNTEYHDIECKIMDGLLFNPKIKMIIKTVIKLKKKANSWKELIEASKHKGVARIQSSSLQDIFNADSQYSILTFPENRPFIYDIMYNYSFVFAILLNYLSEIPSFLPKNAKENQEALRALARIMIYISTYGIQNDVLQLVHRESDNVLVSRKNYAYFTCLSKLKISCKSNVVIHNLDNKAVLISVRKINPGDEIVAMMGNPAIPLDKQKKIYCTFIRTGQVCPCPECMCTGSDHKSILSAKQKEYYRQVNVPQLMANSSVLEIFCIVTEIMHVLSDVSYSDEYIEALQLFCKCIMLLNISKPLTINECSLH